MNGRTEKQKVGDLGERAAAKMLEDKGFTVVTCNFHTRYGEIDIIASDEKYIVFAEVKTRNIDSAAGGAEYVDARKQKKIILSAMLWIEQNNCDLQPRFDVVEVEYDRRSASIINTGHIENAFDAHDHIF